MKFPVVLHTDDGIQFGVTVPDLPGCFSAGKDMDDALQSVVEAIELHTEYLIEEGQNIPVSKPLAVHQKNKDYKGGIWAIVDVPVEKYLGASEKINITVPRMILDRIDAYAKKHGQSRSGFLVDAARRVITSGT